MLPTSAGVKPATSWSPVGHASNCATEALHQSSVLDEGSIKKTIFAVFTPKFYLAISMSILKIDFLWFVTCVQSVMIYFAFPLGMIDRLCPVIVAVVPEHLLPYLP